MDNILSFNDISIYSCREIQDVYNESIMGIFMTEASYFQDMMNKRSSGVLTESVLLEAEESRFKKIVDTIKKFFKDLLEKIKGFFKKIKSLFVKKTQEESTKQVEIRLDNLNKQIGKDWEVGFKNDDDFEKAIKDANLRCYNYDAEKLIDQEYKNRKNNYDTVLKNILDILGSIVNNVHKLQDKYNDKMNKIHSSTSIDNKTDIYKQMIDDFRNELETKVLSKLEDINIPNGYKMKTSNYGEEKTQISKNPYMVTLKTQEHNDQICKLLSAYLPRNIDDLKKIYSITNHAKYEKQIDLNDKYLNTSVNNVKDKLSYVTMYFKNDTNSYTLSLISNNIMKAVNNYSSKMIQNLSNYSQAYIYMNAFNMRNINKYITLANQYINNN